MKWRPVECLEIKHLEAVRTNILGAYNMLNAAIENKAKKVIVLSTDKAVYPINTMGLSKAMMEKLTIAQSRNVEETDTILCCTRYGNVMTSRGSVIPLFVEEIKSGSPITITNPNMTRFLISLEDAVNLVMYAFDNAKQGDIFVHKAPAATIYDLAIAVKKIFNPNAEINMIGIRHGEKVHETLVTKEEMGYTVKKLKEAIEKNR
ncbi:MAG: polysaccharide biosynthesis protein [Clostridiaceae bacterium]|nr:polysaccharide biosynthesis protein [Clostridiaceae bacterium]